MTRGLKSRFQGAEGIRRLVDILGQCHSLCGIDGIAEEIASRCVLAEYDEGDLLTEQGKNDSDVFFILVGRVDVLVNGRRRATRGIRSHVGEMTAIDQTEVRSATIQATLPTVVAKVSESTIAQRQVHLSSGDNYISPILQGGLGGCSPPCF